MSDMHGNAARVAESEAGAERVNSATNTAPINNAPPGACCPSSTEVTAWLQSDPPKDGFAEANLRPQFFALLVLPRMHSRQDSLIYAACRKTSISR